MLINCKKIIAGKCPICNENIYSDITPFCIKGKMIIRCETCDEEPIKIIKKKNNKYMVAVNCFICEKIHQYEVPYDSFWKNDIFALGCHSSGIDICYIGEDKVVHDSMESLDETILQMIDKPMKDSFSEIDEHFEDAMNILNLLFTDGHIKCMCDDILLTADYCPDGIEITCKNCKAKTFIKVKDGNDIENLMNMKEILLKN